MEGSGTEQKCSLLTNSLWCHDENRQKLWRICNFVMFGFFSLAAYVQINDPDAEMWIAIYMIPAVLILFVSLKPDITGHVIWKLLADLHSAVCAIGSIYLSGCLYFYTTKNILHEEEGRELSGLLIITGWLLLCRKSQQSAIGAIRLIIAISVSTAPFFIWIYIYINKEMRTSWPQHCKTVI